MGIRGNTSPATPSILSKSNASKGAAAQDRGRYKRLFLIPKFTKKRAAPLFLFISSKFMVDFYYLKQYLAPLKGTNWERKGTNWERKGT